MKHQIKNKKNRGFSLVEMLVVIAVIGIIAGIAVPSIGAINGKANTAKSKRNAQTIASLYNSSRGVGAAYTATNTSGIIDELVVGKSGADLAGSSFQMSALSGEEKTNAMAYVRYDSDADLMSYDASGGQVAELPTFAEAIEDGFHDHEFVPGWELFETQEDAQAQLEIENAEGFGWSEYIIVEHEGNWILMHQ